MSAHAYAATEYILALWIVATQQSTKLSKALLNVHVKQKAKSKNCSVLKKARYTTQNGIHRLRVEIYQNFKK